MTVKDLIEGNEAFTVVNEADFSREIESIYCCDLLSIVMGRAPSNSAWITVMGNTNGVAVAVLSDISLIIAAEGVTVDEPAVQKAKEQDVNIIKTSLPIYETAILIKEKMNV